MKPKAFDYLRANSVDEAVAGLAKTGEGARILAGGQSLVPILNFRLADPELLIDISQLKELDYIRVDGNMVQIGAATRQAQVMAWPELADRIPLLAKALPHVGHFQTRSRGTVCGSLAHAD
ncbi:MAG: FAD binding domain-containing protein, partial [Rhodospirillales bacterium]|nr:FAD binding domain-containing protein [Rhodospirillales bacterium]